MRNPLRTLAQLGGKMLVRTGIISLTDFDAWMDHAIGYGGIPSAAGVVVNNHSALNYNPVLAAANILGQELASMPLQLFEHKADGSRELVLSPDAYKLAYEPNPLMSSYTWRMVMMGHVMWRGNAISLLNWDNRGSLASLIPIHPDRVRWGIYPWTVAGVPSWGRFQPQGGELWYYVRKQGGEWQPIPEGDVLHIRGLGGDGISGYNIIELLQDSLGIPIAAERFGARYFANDATPGVILRHPGILKDPARENLRKSFNARHQGADNSHVLGILEEGMTLDALPVRADQAQLIETRRFGVEDVSRITRIPAHMLGDLTHATFTNIEHQGLEFDRHCMRNWCINWEQELNRKLFYGTPIFPKFDRSELSLGDALSRAQTNQIKFQNGVLDIDEWRALDGRNPLPMGAGKVRIIPLNMQQLPGTGAPLMPAPVVPNQISAPKEAE